MDVVMLSRLQFAAATMFHFLFVPVTLGLSVLVAAAGNVSAIWILLANGWMQHPVGYTIRNGRAELTDFPAVLTNEFGLLQIAHTIPSAFVLAAFFVMGISAWHLLKRQHIDFFTRSFNIGLVVGLVSSIVVALTGDLHAVHVTETQPAKLAAMESHWDTQSQAPIVLFAVPDAENERNAIEIGRVPGLLSLLGHHDANATVTGLKDIPRDERPPVGLTFASFRLMVALGTLFLLLTGAGMFLRNRLLEARWYLFCGAGLPDLGLPAVQRQGGRGGPEPRGDVLNAVGAAVHRRWSAAVADSVRTFTPTHSKGSLSCVVEFSPVSLP